MFKFVCSNCEKEYHGEHVKNWGKTQESQSYGPRPVCTALVPDSAGGNGVCRGQLVPFAADAAEQAKLDRPKPIAL